MKQVTKTLSLIALNKIIDWAQDFYAEAPVQYTFTDYGYSITIFINTRKLWINYFDHHAGTNGELVVENKIQKVSAVDTIGLVKAMVAHWPTIKGSLEEQAYGRDWVEALTLFRPDML